MNEKAVILRQIKLRRQAIQLNREDIKKLVGVFGLLQLREIFE